MMLRRDFLKLTVQAGGCLMLGINGRIAAGPKNSQINPLVPFIQITPDNLVTFYCYKQEMGQGILNSLGMLVCEELDADWQMFQVKHMPFSTEVENWQEDFGRLNTGGSYSVRAEWQPLRQAAASMRDVLLRAGARLFNVDHNTCDCKQGQVIHSSSGRQVAFGQLIELANSMPLQQDVPLKPKQHFSLIGKAKATNQVTDIISGKLPYSIDLALDGMLHACIVRPPVLSSQVVSLNRDDMLKVNGVVDCFSLSTDLKAGLFNKGVRGGVVIVARSHWGCIQARRQLQVEWSTHKNQAINSDDYLARLKTTHSQASKVRYQSEPYLHQHIEQNKNCIESVYSSPFIAHGLMEPLNAICDYHPDDSLDIWTGTQSPQHTATNLADSLNIEKACIRIHPMHMGGGYGRRYFADFVLEAALISKRMKGPIKLLWSREDEIQFDAFHPMRTDKMRCALDANGNIQHFALQAMTTHEWGGGEISFPYRHQSLSIKSHVQEPDFVQTGPWRAVVAHLDAFSRECFIDELAHKLGQDPLNYRLSQLTQAYAGSYSGDRAERMQDIAKLQSLFARALQILRVFSNWDIPRGKNTAMGVAINAYHNASICAQAAVVTMQDGKIKVTDVYTVADCGLILNPSSTEAQIEGSVLWGLTPVLHGGVDIVEGKCKQSNFHDMPLIGMSETPRCHIKLVNLDERDPLGVGEIAVPTIAPAVLNATYELTGIRHRHLTALAQ